MVLLMPPSVRHVMTAITTRKMAAASPAALSIAAMASSIWPSERTVTTVTLMTEMAVIAGVSLASVEIDMSKVMRTARMETARQETGVAVFVNENIVAMVSSIHRRSAIVVQAQLLLRPNAGGGKTPFRLGSVGPIVGFIVVTVR
jgi:hypothetical protein